MVVHQLLRIAAVDIGCERVSAPPQLSAYGGTTDSVGEALFESVEVGCASCHNGAKLTNIPPRG